MKVKLAAAIAAMALAAPVAATCPGDLTGSGDVGVPDLLQLLSCWGTEPTGACGVADLTGSGTVGVPDLLMLLSNWGSCPCQPQCDATNCGSGDGCGGTCPPCPNPNSCEGSCGGTAPGGCGCDEICCVIDDCCIDKLAVCGGCSPSGPGPTSCIGHCGGNPGLCWCDEDCCFYGDCCADKQLVCGGCS